MDKDSATKAILESLQQGRHLSGYDILRRFGIYRAGAVIYNLRRAGHPISTRIVKLDKGRCYGVYYYDLSLSRQDITEAETLFK